jgi:glycosyltransferase involved in cell wall biosynthesis
MNKHDLKVLVLTPIYSGEGIKKSSTPVVHYFVREWVKQGVDVRVIHYPSNFPKVVNILAKPFQNIIGSKAGSEVRTWQLSEAQYEIEGVKVKRIPLIKLKPHGRYSEREIVKATTKTISYCEAEGFRPDVITSHWVNPQLDIMHRLKAHFGCRAGYVAHDSGADLMGIYSKESKTFLAEIDVIGYRSDAIKRRFEARFHTESKPHFYCYSGIPSKYVDEHLTRKISNRNTLLFVGTLIKRKYPSALVTASVKAFQGDDFKITYIGTGHEENSILQESKKLGVAEKINMLGRVERDEVVRQMDSHTIFAMISRAETFGLVYLEAMARGCITIASRDEGFDGIIRDGENGFLCKAGDSAELAAILSRIKAMPQEELQEISRKAIATAFELTDEKTAATYLQNLLQEKYD